MKASTFKKDSRTFAIDEQHALLSHNTGIFINLLYIESVSSDPPKSGFSYTEYFTLSHNRKHIDGPVASAGKETFMMRAL